MNTIEATKNEVLGTIRDCMTDHGVTVGTVAKRAGITEATMRRRLKTGNMPLSDCTIIYDLTGDKRAYGIPTVAAG